MPGQNARLLEEGARLQRHAVRLVRLSVGSVLLVVGVIGGFVPVLQGWIFILAGLSVMAPESPTAQRALDWLKRKLNPGHASESSDDRKD